MCDETSQNLFDLLQLSFDNRNISIDDLSKEYLDPNYTFLIFNQNAKFKLIDNFLMLQSPKLTAEIANVLTEKDALLYVMEKLTMPLTTSIQEIQKTLKMNNFDYEIQYKITQMLTANSDVSNKFLVDNQDFIMSQIFNIFNGNGSLFHFYKVFQYLMVKCSNPFLILLEMETTKIPLIYNFLWFIINSPVQDSIVAFFVHLVCKPKQMKQEINEKLLEIKFIEKLFMIILMEEQNLCTVASEVFCRILSLNLDGFVALRSLADGSLIYHVLYV
jgi:hypothetical protein